MKRWSQMMMCSSQQARLVGQAARNCSPLQRCLGRLSSCSLGSKKQEIRCLMWPSGTPPSTLAKHLRQIRKRPRRSKEDMFREVLHCSSAEKRECKECWEAERQDRKEDQEFKDATERKIKIERAGTTNTYTASLFLCLRERTAQMFSWKAMETTCNATLQHQSQRDSFSKCCLKASLI
ncbi:uncharacterized protein LOC102936090 [Chelonia mydas]|uniref:uncharacterized protein LOC102936090 n=1 Tax=Chelonia mydas TaxID=8469 RepID=UPI001CAA2F12|nr:uncharacterized protein LOC102936090 [Chelonia mydas]